MHRRVDHDTTGSDMTDCALRFLKADLLNAALQLAVYYSPDAYKALNALYADLLWIGSTLRS